jgi:hypothetical protein
VNQLINVALAEKVSTLRTEEYFAERAAKDDIRKRCRYSSAQREATRLFLAMNCPQSERVDVVDRSVMPRTTRLANVSTMLQRMHDVKAGGLTRG